jgi:hypothetical protein
MTPPFLRPHEGQTGALFRTRRGAAMWGARAAAALRLSGKLEAGDRLISFEISDLKFEILNLSLCTPRLRRQFSNGL